MSHTLHTKNKVRETYYFHWFATIYAVIINYQLFSDIAVDLQKAVERNLPVVDAVDFAESGRDVLILLFMHFHF